MPDELEADNRYRADAAAADMVETSATCVPSACAVAEHVRTRAGGRGSGLRARTIGRKCKTPGSDEPGVYRAGEGIRTLDVNLGKGISAS